MEELNKNSGVKAFINSVINTDIETYNNKINGWLGPLPKEFRKTMEPIINTGVSREELIGILKDMSLVGESVIINQPEKNKTTEHKPYTKTKNPNDFKVGDVLMHPVFKHPYVLLENKGDYWICGLFTTEPKCKEILEKCQSRFFTDSYFTRTLITVTKIYGSFIFPYDNMEHLEEMKRKLNLAFEVEKTGIRKIINTIKSLIK